METFIISYMIANEVVGVVMAVGFVKYLRKSGFFIQRKIAKWRSKNLLPIENFGMLSIILRTL